MNWNHTIFLSILVWAFAVSASAQSMGDAPIAPRNELTPEQTHLFDELLENETKRDPMAAAVLEADPVRAAALVEVEDGELPPSDTAPYQSPVVGTFIQLSRAWAELTVQDWRQIIRIVRQAGMKKIIIQWSATKEIAYFEPAPEQYEEFYPVLNRLFEAANGTSIEIVLGLSHDPLYWKNINTRNDIRDVYFRVRNTHNLRIQEALLEQFEENSNWTGYYISEEIDDINWREPTDEEVFHQFLLRSSRIIEERDEERSVSISSFFRKRTAPSTYSSNLRDLMSATIIDTIWVQDGIGVEVLPASLIEPYFNALTTQFATPPPAVGIVVEIFEMTSAGNEEFAAQTALPSRVENQLKNASLTGSPIVLFSLFDYADPREGGTEEAVYNVIKNWNNSITSIPVEEIILEEPLTEEADVEEKVQAPSSPNSTQETQESPASPAKETAPNEAPPLEPKGTPGKPPSFLPEPKKGTPEPITGLRLPSRFEHE